MMQSKCEWISVENKELLDKVLEEHKKQYPDEDDVELIVCANTFPRSFMLFYDGKGFFAEDCNGKREYFNVTHWMPLPPLPQEKDLSCCNGKHKLNSFIYDANDFDLLDSLRKAYIHTYPDKDALPLYVITAESEKPFPAFYDGCGMFSTRNKTGDKVFIQPEYWLMTVRGKEL